MYMTKCRWLAVWLLLFWFGDFEANQGFDARPFDQALSPQALRAQLTAIEQIIQLCLTNAQNCARIADTKELRLHNFIPIRAEGFQQVGSQICDVQQRCEHIIFGVFKLTQRGALTFWSRFGVSRKNLVRFALQSN